jgi:hypothetical protein
MKKEENHHNPPALLNHRSSCRSSREATDQTTAIDYRIWQIAHQYKAKSPGNQPELSQEAILYL